MTDDIITIDGKPHTEVPVKKGTVFFCPRLGCWGKMNITSIAIPLEENMQNKPTIDPDKQQDLLKNEFRRGYLSGCEKTQQLTAEQQARIAALNAVMVGNYGKNAGESVKLADYFTQFIIDGNLNYNERKK